MITLIRLIRFLSMWLVNIAVSVVFGVTALITLRKFTDILTPLVGKIWSSLVLFVTGIKLDIQGREILKNRQRR